MNCEISLIIPVRDNPEYTRVCLESIYKHTLEKFKLILIDNNSGPETSGYIRSLKNRSDNIILITNKNNICCAAAWNQGIKASPAVSSYVGILNNDIIVTKDWLKNLVLFAETNDYDLAGPAYREFCLDYDLEKYAEKFIKRNKKRQRLWTYTGFCMLFRKNVFNTVGLFDEKFQIATYEDTDFLYRMKLKNLRYATTGSSFIHHFGSITQKTIKQKISDYEEKNREYFFLKWNFLPLSAGFRYKYNKILTKFKNLLNIW